MAHVVRRWVSGPPAAWWRREIQLIPHGPIWLVRRIGQVHRPDEGYPSEEAALAAIRALLADPGPRGEGWTEVE